MDETARGGGVGAMLDEGGDQPTAAPFIPPMAKPRFASLRRKCKILPDCISAKRNSLIMNTHKASNERVAENTGGHGEACRLPNELLTRIVTHFLPIEDVINVALASKTLFLVARTYKWVKHCIWAGGMSHELRKGFWLYGCGKVQLLQIAVALEVEWISKNETSGRNLFQAPFTMETKDVRTFLREAYSKGSIKEYKAACAALGKALYEFLSKSSLEQAKDDEIQRDITRTFPTHKLFSAPQSNGQKWLHSVLRALSTLDPASGYCQGMNFVAAGFLIHFESPVDSFWLTLCIMRHYDYSLIFAPRVPLVALRLVEYSAILRDSIPEIWQHLRDNSVNFDIFGNQWLMTLFSYFVEPRLLLYVWDVFFVSGWKAFFRVGLSLLDRMKETLLKHNIEGMLKYLQSSRHIIEDATALICKSVLQNAYKFEITASHVDKLAQDYIVNKLLTLISSASIPKKSSNVDNDNFPLVNESSDDETTDMVYRPLSWNSGAGYLGAGEATCGLVYEDAGILILDLKFFSLRNRPLEGVSYEKLLHLPLVEQIISDDNEYSLVPNKSLFSSLQRSAVDKSEDTAPWIKSKCGDLSDVSRHCLSKSELLQKYQSLVARTPVNEGGGTQETNKYEYKDTLPAELCIPSSVLGGSELGRFIALDLSTAKKIALIVNRSNRQTLQDAKVLTNKVSEAEKKTMQQWRAFDAAKVKLEEALTAREESYSLKLALKSALQRLVESSQASAVAPLGNLSECDYDFEALEEMRVEVENDIAASKERTGLFRRNSKPRASISVANMGDKGPNSFSWERPASALSNEEQKMLIVSYLRKVIDAEKSYSKKNAVAKECESEVVSAKEQLNDTLEMKEQYIYTLQEHLASSEAEKGDIILQLLSTGIFVNSVPERLEDNYCPAIGGSVLS